MSSTARSTKSSEERVADRIRTERKKQSLSIQQLAEIVGVSQQTIRRMEEASTLRSAVTLARIARALRIDLSDLFGHVRTIEELANQIWESRELDSRFAGSHRADFKTKKAMLEAMGLWED